MQNDNLIDDIIPMKIDSGMSVSTLYALETIFYMRLQLAQVSKDENEPILNSLCRNRFEQLANALRKKYKSAESIDEKIEILERLAFIGMTIDSRDFSYTLDAALTAGNVTELGKLLTLAAYWSSDPTIRPRLTEASTKAQAIDGLTLPERRLNAIVAEIYHRIETLTGKYDDFEDGQV